MFTQLITDNLVDFPFNFEKHIIQFENYNELEPFPFLNETTINILEKIIKNNMQYLQTNKRTANYIRGIGYRSHFIRELCYNPSILEYLQRLTGITLIPHYLLSNIAHVNIGIDNNKDVDEWHYDSVPYVLIILLSEPTTFEGGILEYEKDGNIHVVDFPHVGNAFFMKGSSLKHRVTRILKGQRISLINSYMDINEKKDNDTKMKTFEIDANVEQEYFYGKTFWVGQQLQNIQSKSDLQYYIQELQKLV